MSAATGVPALVSLVTLGVADVPASTRFYQHLGFELSPASVDGDVSFFRTGGALLGLYGADDLRVDAALAAATAAGARIAKPAQATEWGGYHGYFADLDEHLWEVAYNPFWPIGLDGLPQLP